MDITVSENQILVYLKDPIDNNKAWIAAYDNTFKKLGQKTIMNNGNTPVKFTDQTSFFDNNGVILSGQEAMFSASTGKLAYGRGRYGLLFAHYNAFGTAQARDDHQGDTFFTADYTATQFGYGWTWKTSHSLQQTILYSGKYLITASLGDVFPENIKVCLIDQTTFTTTYDAVNKGNFEHPTYCLDIVNGKICGDGGGKTCGRIGGLVQSGDTIGLVYSRKSCSFVGYKNTQTSSSDSEIGLITFQIVNFAITNQKYYTFGKGDMVIAIRAVKYGKNIFISYTSSTTGTGNDPQQQYVIGDKTVEVQTNMIVDFLGNVVVPSTANTGNNNVSPTDEIRFLADGTPTWTYIDQNNKLYLYQLQTPPMVSNVNTNGQTDSPTNGSGGSSSGGSSSGGSTAGGTSSNTTSSGILSLGVSIIIITLSLIF
jgi:uncharacterized membrane protein YgcG